MDINKLTLYSHGAGCGCKIAPDVLSRILGDTPVFGEFPDLLVGYEEKDDAAVLDLGDGTALISTTDFFMPIVDDPFDFGRIAAVNALSDVYAMGGKPLMAIAILGWPVNQLDPSLAAEVLRGGRESCRIAGIPLAGGHSIDALEPFFGLAVSGRVPLSHIKRNRGARPGDLLYLSKPLGTGILTTAQKLERLKAEHQHIARDLMLRSNELGYHLGALPWVHAMTDVTGFGLLGHLLEVCQASGIGAEILYPQVPVLGEDRLDWYIRMQCTPAATERNAASLKSHGISIAQEVQAILCDPQTSGGLLVAVDPERQGDFERMCKDLGHDKIALIGCCTEDTEPLIRIQT
jgi:selenide, water dikinase